MIRTRVAFCETHKEILRISARKFSLGEMDEMEALGLTSFVANPDCACVETKARGIAVIKNLMSWASTLGIANVFVLPSKEYEGGYTSFTFKIMNE